MSRISRLSMWIAFLSFTANPVPQLPAKPLQARAAKSISRACELLSVAEIKTATGIAAYISATTGDEPGQGAGGGSSCQYDGPVFGGPMAPMVSLVFISGKNWTEAAKNFKLAEGCSRETASGVGDQAFFEVCKNSRLRRSPPLYVKVGTYDLIVEIDTEAGVTEANARDKVIAIAKAAVAKLR